MRAPPLAARLCLRSLRPRLGRKTSPTPTPDVEDLRDLSIERSPARSPLRLDAGGQQKKKSPSPALDLLITGNDIVRFCRHLASALAPRRQPACAQLAPPVHDHLARSPAPRARTASRPHRRATSTDAPSGGFWSSLPLFGYRASGDQRPGRHALRPTRQRRGYRATATPGNSGEPVRGRLPALANAACSTRALGKAGAVRATPRS